MIPTPVMHENPFDALHWYAQMGVDLCVEETAQSLTAQVTRVPPAFASAHSAVRPEDARAQVPPAPTARVEALASIAEAVAHARQLAQSAPDLAALELAVRDFSGCALKKTASHTVFGDGVPHSTLMLIGDAPASDDDRSGQPFSGPNGTLLDAMLRAIGISRQQNCYLANTLFWRPPGNRQPTPEELEICRPLVEKQIALVNPQCLVLAGGTSASALLKDNRGITRLRGQRFDYQNEYITTPIPVYILYHPSYLLRHPLAKKQAWADLLALRAFLTTLG